MFGGRQVLATGEGRKVLVIAAAMMLLAHLRRRELRKRWLKDRKPESALFDHPAFVYLLENAIVFLPVVLTQKYAPLIDRSKPVRLFIHLYMWGTWAVETGLLSQKLLARYAYHHVPYFSKTKPPSDLKTIVNDYLTCNFPASVINTLIQWSLVMAMPEPMYEKARNPPPIEVLPFLAKLLYSRIVVDIVFGVAHRIMHENKWIYDNVHKRHHEHTAPRTQTNYHFTALDIFLEAIFPLYADVVTMHLLDWAPTRFEQELAFAPLIFYESASHTGKEIPFVSWFPPLAPLVNSLTGCDEDLVLYHTRHHQQVKRNYSISPWPDKLMGTYRMDLPDGYTEEADHDW